MRYNVELAREKLLDAQAAQKFWADWSRQEAQFQIEQQVYLRTKNLPLTYSNLQASAQENYKISMTGHLNYKSEQIPEHVVPRLTKNVERMPTA
jgi:DNA-nicking Smr family endonuclease